MFQVCNIFLFSITLQNTASAWRMKHKSSLFNLPFKFLHYAFHSASLFSLCTRAVADLRGCHLTRLCNSYLFDRNHKSNALGWTCWLCNHFCMQIIESVCYTSSVDASAVQTVVVKVFKLERKNLYGKQGKFTNYLPDRLQNPQNSLTEPNA